MNNTKVKIDIIYNPFSIYTRCPNIYDKMINSENDLDLNTNSENDSKNDLDLNINSKNIKYYFKNIY